MPSKRTHSTHRVRRYSPSTVKALDRAIKDEKQGQMEYAQLATKLAHDHDRKAFSTALDIRDDETKHEKKLNAIKRQNKIPRSKRNTTAKTEKFISSHPEHYGYDDEKYAAVAVVEKNGKIVEVHPTTNYEAAVKILKQL